MIGFELVCLGIVVAFLLLRSLRSPERAVFFEQYFRWCFASWLVEETVIHAYGFYAYATEWTITLDRVPLMVVLIWPVVIVSARDLASALLRRVGWPVAALTGLIVVTDAALIEPIAVRAGLWRWFEPGIFEVPPVGILGWAVFAALCVHAEAWPLSSGRKRRWGLVLATTLLGTHAFLLLAWWGALRWMNHPVPETLSAVVAGCVSLAVVGLVLKRRLARRLQLRELLMRLPAALVFFALLARHLRDGDTLLAYALAFALPYLVLCLGCQRSSSIPSTASEAA